MAHTGLKTAVLKPARRHPTKQRAIKKRQGIAERSRHRRIHYKLTSDHPERVEAKQRDLRSHSCQRATRQALGPPTEENREAAHFFTWPKSFPNKGIG
ncbi:Hypothetical predicted protein [Pelobates cultripes]|uniref:Uncharacterized protein n=1 Tax=Pelobates cultripes TaxID=61616 RepID=A0AAD1R0R2_PELCU|nr:Hypothetical predicted protein [Pelobates cultripes]